MLSNCTCFKFCLSVPKNFFDSAVLPRTTLVDSWVEHTQQLQTQCEQRTGETPFIVSTYGTRFARLVNRLAQPRQQLPAGLAGDGPQEQRSATSVIDDAQAPGMVWTTSAASARPIMSNVQVSLGAAGQGFCFASTDPHATPHTPDCAAAYGQLIYRPISACVQITG